MAKYMARPPGTAGSGIPTATTGVVPSKKFWVPGVPLRTRSKSPRGRLAVDRLSSEEYGVPWKTRTDWAPELESRSLNSVVISEASAGRSACSVLAPSAAWVIAALTWSLTKKCDVV